MPIETCLRPYNAKDFGFVHSSWLKSFHPPDIERKVYSHNHSKLIKALIKKSKIVVACNVEDYDQIFGYLVYELEPVQIVHYCYVKQVFRGQKISRSMLEECLRLKESAFATHKTRCFSYFANIIELFYNPYLLLEAVNEN